LFLKPKPVDKLIYLIDDRAFSFFSTEKLPTYTDHDLAG